jgi:hypothetical protein
MICEQCFCIESSSYLKTDRQTDRDRVDASNTSSRSLNSIRASDSNELFSFLVAGMLFDVMLRYVVLGFFFMSRYRRMRVLFFDSCLSGACLMVLVIVT